MGRKRQAVNLNRADIRVGIPELEQISEKPTAVEASSRDSTFTNSIGRAPCPQCNAPWAPVRNTMPPDNGKRIRHHVCRRCGHRFKSVESLC